MVSVWLVRVRVCSANSMHALHTLTSACQFSLHRKTVIRYCGSETLMLHFSHDLQLKEHHG